MFGLSGDHASQVMEKDEEEQQQQLLGGARKSHVGLLQAFATGERLSPGRDGGSSVESLLQGSSSSSEMTAEGVDGSGLICNSAMAMDRSCLEQLTTVGASTLSTDMLRESLEIMAQSELELMSPGASERTVSDSSASRTSGQSFGRVFFSHLQLAGGPDTVPDQCTMEPTVFRAPLHVSGETWRGGESSDGIVCSEGDVIYDATTTTPQMQKLQYPVSQGISGTPLTSVPLLFPFPGTLVISEPQAKAMMIPAANPAMRPILTIGGGAPAAAIPPSSSRTLLVPEMELLSASRPKRRNVRISKDPQSVAARHRRERISDRIRMLQRLVPGGTKMDTASMLDEAIQYVKFLKLQLQVSVSSLHQIYCNSTNSLQENVIRFSHKKPQRMTHVWGKHCGFIDYNVQYVVFIV